MRFSLTCLGRKKPRLLASEILKNVEALKTPAKPLRSQEAEFIQAPDLSVNPFFQQLPPTLANFFKKYPPAPFRKYADKPVATNAEDANPFLPNKNPVTGRYAAPKYSLRRQSDLYKAAYRFGIAHLLPKLGNNKKFYEDKHLNKTPVRGSVMFKLTKGERTKDSRIQEVNEALSKADEIIAEHRGRAYRRKLERKSQQTTPWF
uniref:ARAD1D30184p n=1 Tax=Blastobotrys adeninivorans TaxID=409370 RepID=A0A060TGG2_BLAAD